MSSPRDDERMMDSGGRVDLSCPECRSRWLDGLPGRRSPTRAGIVAATVLVAIAAGPAAAVDLPAADQEREGEAAPELGPPAEGGDPAQEVEFDPGGTPLALPEESPPDEEQAPVVAPPTDEEGEVEEFEQEPPIDEEALIGEQELVTPPVDLAPAAQETAPPPAVPEAVPPAPAPPAPPQIVPEVIEPPLPDRDHAERQGRAERRQRSARGRRSQPPARTDAPSNQVVAQVPQIQRAEGTAGSQLAEVGADEPVVEAQQRGARAYIVRPGDSLWSIAERLLGGDADVSQVARMVKRLWEMNEGRIGTGDPDLLLAGTRLRLP